MRQNEPVTDELIARVEAHFMAVVAQMNTLSGADPLVEKWSHKAGTPETLERASCLRQSPLSRLMTKGKISRDQLRAGEEIQMAAEWLRRDVGLKLASYEARVDTSRSSAGVGIESLFRVVIETTYRRWWSMIPARHRPVVLEVIIEEQSYVAAARRHRVHYRTARRAVIRSLDSWADVRDTSFDHVGGV